MNFAGLQAGAALPAYAEAQKGAAGAEEGEEGLFGGTRGAAGKERKTVYLIPCGTPFGVRFYTDGALIRRVNEGSAAESAGLAAGDLIVGVNGEKVGSIPEFFAALEKSGGEVRISYVRTGAQEEATLRKPEKGGEEALGLRLRDMMAGIGTLTYYDPETGLFAGLGHGICRDGTAELLPLGRGSITDVRITSVKKGERGSPGQLRGLFCPGERGVLKKNEAQGVFGVMTGAPPEGEALPAARFEEVRAGKAEILCTVGSEGRARYKVEIEKIFGDGGDGKNYLLRVTDERLLEAAGGIVQGMSGSPILQNGRIVGAVTHVLVEDPAKGYGIYIGNMLEKQG